MWILRHEPASQRKSNNFHAGTRMIVSRPPRPKVNFTSIDPQHHIALITLYIPYCAFAHGFLRFLYLRYLQHWDVSD